MATWLDMPQVREAVHLPVGRYRSRSNAGTRAAVAFAGLTFPGGFHGGGALCAWREGGPDMRRRMTLAAVVLAAVALLALAVAG
jgi:hypothetical protein